MQRSIVVLALFVVVSRATAGAASLEAHECAARPAIVTSELSVQVYLVAPIGGGLLPAPDHEVIVRDRRQRQYGKTDSRGFLRFRGLKPGDYLLHVPGAMDGYYQDVRVTRRSLGPNGTIAVVANMTCGHACVVAGAGGPLVEPPACLFSPRR